jgi:hypothetical protein
MTSVVRSFDTIFNAAWISCSVWVSSAEVASSRIRIGGCFENGPGDGDALLLTAGQLQPALADHRVVAIGSASMKS